MRILVWIVVHAHQLVLRERLQLNKGELGEAAAKLRRSFCCLIQSSGGMGAWENGNIGVWNAGRVAWQF